MRVILILTFLLMTSFKVSAQQDPRLPSVSKQEMTSIITILSQKIRDNYVFEDVGNKMGDYISSQLSTGKYDNITKMQEFLMTLHDDLVSISHDKHFNLQYNPPLFEELSKPEDDKKEMLEVNQDEIMKKENYAFKKVEILPGNVAYIDLRMFYFSDDSKKTVDAVMGFVSNADALIFDMRNNGGGDPNLVKYIISYLYDGKPIHLNDLYYRVGNKTEEYWTEENLPGKKMPNVPVYVLTSGHTFSGAEEFTYNLKNLKRGTIVGENTGGGANPVNSFVVSNNVVVRIPVGRAISPITKTNWEGTGISPDFQTSENDAFNKAMSLALENLSSKTNDPQWKKSIEWSKMIYDAKLTSFTPSASDLEKIAGDYGKRMITLDNGQLIYKNKVSQISRKMTALSRDTYMLENLDDVMVKVDWDADKIKGINIVPMNAPEDYSARMN